MCVVAGKSGRIDYSLPPGHPFSFEVDHLTPISLGGDPYDPRNQAAAHRVCNEWRGNRTYEQTVAELKRLGGPQQGKPDPLPQPWPD